MYDVSEISETEQVLVVATSIQFIVSAASLLKSGDGGSVSDGLLGVEGALLSGEALNQELRLLVYENLARSGRTTGCVERTETNQKIPEFARWP